MFMFDCRNRMIGRLRVPPCFIKTPFPGKSGKIAIITWKDIKKNWVLMPLVLIKICVLTSAALLAAHRLFWTTIDVRLYDYYRFEIPPVPRFFDLRNPRPLKHETVAPFDRYFSLSPERFHRTDKNGFRAPVAVPPITGE
uniref:uncharacterized protein LOC117604995 isoform X3 n=1 Tax=Osmia lignaria TaxID=473952 RepID=UPI00147868E4|nr:uncharacterized protein LOC117604995 isoform X3 [Osmia lignaria]